MDFKSPFGPMQKREQLRSNVVGFPGRQWREERLKIVRSNDPIDVSLSSDAKSLHKEVDRRMDQKQSAETRSGVFHETIDKAAKFLGLKDEE